MRAAFAVSWIAFTLGCSSGASNDSSASDAGHDGTSTDVGDDGDEASTDTTPPPDACGAPPYFTYTVQIGEIINTGDSQPLAGATLEIDLCPERTFTSGASGFASAHVQRGAAFTATMSAPDHVTVIAGEELVPVDDPLVVDHFVELMPTTNAAVIPGYSTDAPSLAIVIQPDGVAGSPCNDTVNVKFDVPTGVTAHYMLPDWPKDTTEPITDASIGPVVFFTGVTGTETTVFSSTTGGAEATCKAIDHGSPTHQTGKVKLAPGAWSVVDVARVNAP